MYERTLPLLAVGALYYYFLRPTPTQPVLLSSHLYAICLAIVVYITKCFIVVIIDGYLFRPLLYDAPILTGGERVRVCGSFVAGVDTGIANFRTFAGISTCIDDNNADAKDEKAAVPKRRTIKCGTAYRSGEVRDVLVRERTSSGGNAGGGNHHPLHAVLPPPKTVVDLRDSSEAAAAPSYVSPPGRIVHLPISPLSVLSGRDQRLKASTLCALYSSIKSLILFHPKSLFEGKASTLTLHQLKTLVVELLILEPGFADSAVAKLIKLAGDPANHPILWHCLDGKDRTGAMSALFLLALGVPRGAVVDDFMLSNKLLYRKAANNYIFLRLVWLVTGNWLSFIKHGDDLGDCLLVQEETLERCFAQVDAVYGGFNARYWREQGVTEEDLARLREAVLR